MGLCVVSESHDDCKSCAAEETSASASLEMNPENLLQVSDLYTSFQYDGGVVRAVDGVTFEVGRKKVLGLVGESGCGKSVTALSIMQLLPVPKGRIDRGQILFDRGPEHGIVDIAQLSPRGKVMRSIRGNDIAMIFQEPMTSLNPVYTIGDQIIEAVMLHQNVSKKEALDIAVSMLDKVGIPAPAERVSEFPHRLSGGMRQRAMIAMALSCNPRFLIADEPTTALDVTIQAQILDLMRRLQEEYQMSILMITHNLGVVGRMCDDVAVMYLGKIVERGTVRQILKDPLHPYTLGLLRSIPSIERSTRGRLQPIKGTVPSPYEAPSGCRFRTRCEECWERCDEEPPLFEADGGRMVRCWLHER